MDMNKPLNVALVGYGYWGPNLLRNFLQHPNIQVSWVVDLETKNLAKAQLLAAHIKVTTNLDEMLQDSQVDFVALAVPTKLHFPLAKKVLEAKKHVLIEKPFTQTVEQALALKALAEKQSCHLFVDHPYVFSAPIQQLKNALSSKELGDLYYIESRRLNLGLIQSDINVIDDLSPHDFSILDFLLDGEEPLLVVAQGSNYTKSGQVERAHIELQYENGISANVHLSWLSPLKVREIFCVGSQKMVTIDDTAPSEKLKIYDKGVEFNPSDYSPLLPFYRSGEVHIPHLPNTEPLLQMIDACYKKITQNVPAANDIDAAIRVVKLIERSQAALNEYLKETHDSR